ncbi:hypothetical protein [Tateyamaria sp. SN6-1]
MKLRQVELPQGQGATIAEAMRQIGVTQQSFIDGGRALAGSFP